MLAESMGQRRKAAYLVYSPRDDALTDYGSRASQGQGKGPGGQREAAWLQQVPRLEIQILIDQRGGEVFREDIQREDSLRMQVGQHLLPPDQNLRRRCGTVQRRALRVGLISVVEDASVA